MASKLHVVDPAKYFSRVLLAEKYGWEYCHTVGGHLSYRKPNNDEGSRSPYSFLIDMGGKLDIQKEQWRNRFTGVVKDETQLQMIHEMLELI